MPRELKRYDNIKAFTHTQKEDRRDFIAVEIGDTKDASKFHPQFKMTRWNNEANVSFRLIDDWIPVANEHYSESNGVIEWKKMWKGKDWIARFYEDWTNSDGAYKFVEMVLPEKPPTNQITFSVVSKDVAFFYQPELTQQEIDEGAIRPDEVVGSYAIYSKSSGGMNSSDGKDYKVGKVGHLFRAYLEDANGDRIWADYNTDLSETGILTITVDQTWINNAAYPVTLDPTFGYTGVGASFINVSTNDHVIAGQWTIGENGSLDSITIYSDSDNVTNCSAFNVIYNDSSDAPGSLKGTSSSRTVSDNELDWFTQSMSSESLVASTPYWLAIHVTTTSQFGAPVKPAYDSNTNNGAYKSVAQNTWTSPQDPFPASPTTATTREYSYYATYTPSYTGSTETLYVNGDGNDTSGWRSEGGDYQKVDETTPDDGTTYLYGVTADDLASFTLTNPSFAASSTINAIWVYAYVYSVDPVDSTFQIYARTNSTNYYSSTLTGHSSLGYFEFVNKWTTNPNTASAWTVSDLTSLEVGVKKINTAGQRLTMMKVVVDYTAPNVEQEGFRFRNDDGSESAATWLASQDANSSITSGTNVRLRMLLNATGAAGSTQYQLEYKEKVSGSYAIVPLDVDTYGSELTSGGTASASHENGPSEGAAQAFDDSSSTKWLAFNTTPWLQYQFGSSATHVVGKYTLTSGNDDDTRDPYTWTLQGSNNGSTWDNLDTQTAQTFASRGLTKEYTFSNSTAYEYYRLNVTANNGNGSITQLAELSLYAIQDRALYMSGSSNITASGEATTAQLTAPSGKTTGDFDAGRIQDDENPADAVAITADDYTELEWCIVGSSAVEGDTFQFRVTDGGATLTTYTVTPELQITAGGGGGGSLSLRMLTGFGS